MREKQRDTMIFTETEGMTDVIPSVKSDNMYYFKREITQS